MNSLLASYRWRRRLTWLTVAAAAVGCAVAVGLMWPNTARQETTAPSNVRLHIDYRPPKAIRLKNRDRARALAVAATFIDTAVARKHIDRSWKLVTPELRAGLTRKTWSSGNIPIVPYPVGSARWKLDYADVNGIGFQIALFPTKGSHERAQIFLIGLHPVSTGRHRHWLVESWQPAPTTAARQATGTGGSGGTLADVSPNVNHPLATRSKESPVWLLLPVGLLSLILLIPLGIGALSWYRNRAAAALVDR